MADEFNPRKPKNSCDVNDRWNALEWATNTDTSFGTSNPDIFARPNSNFTDQFRREIPICWDRASARFGNAALLAEKSPFTPKTRSLIQCSVVPLDNTNLASLFLLGLGHIFAFSRHIKDFKIDGTVWHSGKPQEELHNSLYEVSFYLPEQGTIKFKVFVDKEGKITPALKETRQFLDKRVDVNQPKSPDFTIEPSAENPNQFVLKSGSIELTVNLEFAQEVTPPASDKTVSYYNQRVILAKSQPPSPLKIGDEKERARFVSQKKAGNVIVLQRQTLELTRVIYIYTHPATVDNPERKDVSYKSHGKIHQIILSDGKMAQIRKMDTGEVVQEESFLYIPDHQTGEVKEVALRNTGQGLVAEGYEYGFRIEKAGAQTPFTLVNRETIEPEKVDLQKELETLEAEAQDDSYSRENQYINKFRRAVIATFVGNEHLLSGSDLLFQMERRQRETLDQWRVRVIRALDAFKIKNNEFIVAGNAYSTSNAPRIFYDTELNPPSSTRKPKLHDLLRTPITNSDLERRINEIPEPRSLVIERKGSITALKPRKEPSEIVDDEFRALSEPPTEAEEAALASLIDRGKQTARPARGRRGALPDTGAGEPPMSIPPTPPAVTPTPPTLNPEEAIEKLTRDFILPLHSKPVTVTAFSKFGTGDPVTEVKVEYLGMNVDETSDNKHLFRLSVANGPTLYLVTNKTFAPKSALVDGERVSDLKQLKRSEQNRIFLKSGTLTVGIDPELFKGLITSKPVRPDYQLVSISGFTPAEPVDPRQCSADEPMSIDPSLKLQPQTEFADYDVREEVVERVANSFGISIDSIWDLKGPAHRGMSLDQITQTGNHFAYQREGTRLQIEFDRSSTNPHFADVANLRITYDGQIIPFEYTVEQGRPYLFLKEGLHGVVFYLSPNADGSYAVTEATHPIIREQAERDMGYTASPRPENISYLEIRENFLSLPSDKQTLYERIFAQQIYRNRLGRLKEAEVLPKSLEEQTLIAKRLGADSETFNRRNSSTFPQLHKLEEIAKDEKLKEQLREGLQRLAVASDKQKTEEALAWLERLEKEVDSGKSEVRPPVAAPLVEEATTHPAVSEAPAVTAPVCEAPPTADKTKEPLVSTQPPPNLLIRALESLGETGQKLIKALFPSEADAATQPILEDADVRHGFLGIARFFGIPDEQLTTLLSPDSAETQTAQAPQVSVTSTSTPDPESEPVCREPEQPKNQSVPSDQVDGEAKSEGFKEEKEAVCKEKQEDQSVPSDQVDGESKSKVFNEDDFRQELAIHRGDVNARFNSKHHQEKLAKAISYIKGSGATEVKDFVLAIEACLPAENHEKETVLWDFLGRVLRYRFDYKPMREHVIGALGRNIKEMSQRLEKLEELETFIRNNEEEKREAEKERRSEKVAP